VLLFTNIIYANGDPNTKDKGIISGKVIDNKTGESLVGAIISIEGTEIKTYTDFNGDFLINSVEPGNYNLIVSLISYKKSLIENLKLNYSEKEVINIKLDEIR
jgi:hypothetical protein